MRLRDVSLRTILQSKVHRSCYANEGSCINNRQELGLGAVWGNVNDVDDLNQFRKQKYFGGWCLVLSRSENEYGLSHLLMVIVLKGEGRFNKAGIEGLPSWAFQSEQLGDSFLFVKFIFFLKKNEIICDLIILELF